VSPRDLWALLAGQAGASFPMWVDHGLFWTPVDAPALFERRLEAWGWLGDLEVGMPRLDRSLGRPAALEVLWARAETPAARSALERFDPAPTLRIGVGAREDAFWGLSRALDRDHAERANKRIAHALGTKKKDGDPWGFRFSPPGTVLRAGGRPRAVGVLSWTGELHGVRAIVGGLPDPPDPDAWKNRD
jgi:hypothetical protein